MALNRLKGKRILVTGATGFVGAHLTEQLVQMSAHVVGTYQTFNPRSYFARQKLDRNITLVPLDLNDFDKVHDLITKTSVDYIFHLAAQPLVDVAYANPRRTLLSNIQGTINILESVRLSKKAHAVIVASSDKAYGKNTRKKYKETNPLKGDHPYEVSKSSADLISYSYFKTYQVPVIITRFGNIYGEGDLNFSRIIPGIMESLVTGSVLQIRSDGKYIRDYLYVKDVAAGYILLATAHERLIGEAFNFGSNDTLSVIEMIKRAERVLQKKIKYKILNTAKNEINYQSLNFSKIRKMIQWRPHYTIDKILPQIYTWYKSYFYI